MADRSQVQLSCQWILSRGTVTPVCQFHPFTFAQRHETLNMCVCVQLAVRVRSVGCLSRRKACVTALTVLEKLSDRDWHFLLRCVEVSQSVLCDQNTAECQHVKICPSLLLQHSDTQCQHVKICPSLLLRHSDTQCQHVKICPSLLLQHSDTQVSACSSTTHVSTFPVRSFSGLQPYKHPRKIKMFTRLCIIEGNCLYVDVFCLDVCNIEVCRCANDIANWKNSEFC